MTINHVGEPIMSEQESQLHRLLDQYDGCLLECDGLIQVLSTVLTREGIPHSVYIGCITYVPTLQAFAPHYWIGVGAFTVDFRADMWLRNLPNIPHGIFCQKDYPVEYEGEVVPCDPLPGWLFSVLTDRHDWRYEISDNLR